MYDRGVGVMTASISTAVSQGFGPRAMTLLVAAGALAALAGCAGSTADSTPSDPREAQNREIHAFNKGVDRYAFRPASKAYGAVLPDPIEAGISNAAHNLAEPTNVVNSLLQGRVQNAGVGTLRFALNSTVGLLGLFDPASAMGVERKETDFGETLHVWGVSEGAYAEVPLIGPTTDRDLAGKVVDFAMSPWRYVLPTREANAVTAIGLASKLGDRSKYSDTVDSVLYESADSYAQTRLMYLQNRRYKLGQTSGSDGDDGFVDPYEDAANGN